MSTIMKLMAVVVGTILLLGLLTLAWLSRYAAGRGSAVDVGVVLFSPLYWVMIVVVFALAVWACCRWVFALKG